MSAGWISLPLLFLRALAIALALTLTLALTAPALGERAPAPMWLLANSPFQLEVTVLSAEEKRESRQITRLWHRVRIERVFVGTELKVGDETAVVSSVVTNPPGTTGGSGDRGPFKGPNGLPIPGDRARLFAHGSAAILHPVPPNGWQSAERTVAFVAADDEYRSEVTMPFLAKLVEEAKVARTKVHYATGDDGRGSVGKTPDPAARTGLTEGWMLGRADMTVLFMRFRELEYNTMLGFADATTFGLPLVGFRTSTHAFRYPETSRSKRWNDDFPREQFGTGWTFHHGHSSTTRILPPDAESAKHPVLAGLHIPPEGLVVPSWLYSVEPLGADCRVLLFGEAIGSERKDAPQRQPILWVRETPRTDGLPPRRIAFTTLGHPGDFANPEVRVMAVQMISWALGEEARMDDATRATIRGTVFEPRPIR